MSLRTVTAGLLLLAATALCDEGAYPASVQETGTVYYQPAYDQSLLKYDNIPFDHPIIAVKKGALSFALKKIAFVAKHLVAVAIGSILVLGLCKLTPVCGYVAQKLARKEVPSPEELRALSKPALKMLKSAIDKYGKH